MSQLSLTDKWRDSLKRCEELALECGTRSRWLYLTRARIYRLLLSMYGSDYAEREPFVPTSMADDANSQFSEKSDLVGKPPKNNQLILSTLKRVAASNESPRSGTSSQASCSGKLFLVHAERRGERIRFVERELMFAGVYFESRSRWGQRQILVPFETRQRAAKIARDVLQKYALQKAEQQAEFNSPAKQISSLFAIRLWWIWVMFLVTAVILAFALLSLLTTDSVHLTEVLCVIGVMGLLQLFSGMVLASHILYPPE